jgi:hypothetical protein
MFCKLLTTTTNVLTHNREIIFNLKKVGSKRDKIVKFDTDL